MHEIRKNLVARAKTSFKFKSQIRKEFSAPLLWTIFYKFLIITSNFQSFKHTHKFRAHASLCLSDFGMHHQQNETEKNCTQKELKQPKLHIYYYYDVVWVNLIFIYIYISFRLLFFETSLFRASTSCTCRYVSEIPLCNNQAKKERKS